MVGKRSLQGVEIRSYTKSLNELKIEPKLFIKKDAKSFFPQN